MIPVTYTCKICNRSGTAHADDETPRHWIDKLKKLLTCNPCYIYHGRRQRAHDWIRDKAIQVSNIQAVKHDASREELDKLLEPSRLSLVAGTKRYAEIVCRHYHHATKWEPDLVTQIMESPQKVIKILFHYERLIKTGEYR